MLYRTVKFITVQQPVGLETFSDVINNTIQTYTMIVTQYMCERGEESCLLESQCINNSTEQFCNLMKSNVSLLHEDLEEVFTRTTTQFYWPYCQSQFLYSYPDMHGAGQDNAGYKTLMICDVEKTFRVFGTKLH